MLFSRTYLHSLWERDYISFKDSSEAKELHERLKNWASRLHQKETEAESAFIDLFFKQTWDYHANGVRSDEEAFTLWPQFPIKRAGAGGGTGKADIALGYFSKNEAFPIPQVLGEFKDDRSGLDTPQKGRKNDRSPVQQCFDYLREARSGLNAPVLPTWGIVTDMNEFRLYIYGNRTEYQRFFIDEAPGGEISLVDDSEAAAFERFLFYRMFHREWLLSDIGKSKLQQLLDGQLIYEQSLENDFYAEYHAYREAVFQALQEHNPSYQSNEQLFKLVKFTQRFLDRIIFVLYCEDMGQMLDFPPNILRDILIEVSSSRFYDPNGGEAWFRIKELFRAMGEGLPFGGHAINRFNGGLFADDVEMNALHFPNALFCVQGQAESEARILQHPKTLLYFSAKYNFGEDESGEGRSLSLTAMGRIFEQSITDLEVMEAHAQGRESLVELTKRKRDGVYYTPEWVTRYIVENTIGSRLAEIRKELGFDAFTGITDEQIAAYHTDKRKHKVVGKYADALYRYSEKLNAFKVVDPACGSGAFLVQAFRYLYEQRRWMAQERRRIDTEASLFDVDATIRDILSENIYGVDINAESVEITKLTLWLNTAAKDKPLTKLDDNIRCGNSLVGTDFYEQLGIDEGSFPELKKERVNPFDWHSAFPDVFDKESSGFDAVVGNPPYVKLQHFRRIDEETASYLLQAVAEDGSPLYESTQSGNFDLYLPFIEKGISLLNEEGKMGYIAPNLWLLNDYGKALRQRVKRQRNLERWIDFKSYQVFSDAITYTALQFFTAHPNEAIRCAFAPKGREEAEMVNWDDVEDTIAYDELPEDQSWVFVTRREKVLIDKLAQSCKRLDEITDKIFQGLVTSADYIYHLKRLAPGRYLHKPKKSKEWKEVALEDAVMRPLVSGSEAKRYLEPKTDTWLLFPYELTKDGPRLIGTETFEQRYPLAWAYLKRYENALRGRESGKMDKDEKWWGFVYPKSLDKQEHSKLIVPRLIKRLYTTIDIDGIYYLDNADVSGVLSASKDTLHFLNGLLNAPVANFVWRRISKPFQNDYRSANKQFIAPLPIPEVDEVQKAQVVELAKALQSLHTQRRDKIDAIDKRLASTQCEEEVKGYEWLWAEVKPVSEFKKMAPNELTRREKTAWAKEKHEHLLKSKLGVIDALLKPGVKLEAWFDDGELTLFLDGIPTLHLYLDDEEGRFVAAQWRQKIRQTNITEKFDAKKLIKLLLSLKRTENTALREQILRREEEIADIETKIGEKEDAMNRLVYGLYGLEEEDIALIEQMEGAT